MTPTKEPNPAPFVVFVDKLTERLFKSVLQTIPLSRIGDPPSVCIYPPHIAVVGLMLETGAVFNELDGNLNADQSQLCSTELNHSRISMF